MSLMLRIEVTEAGQAEQFPESGMVEAARTLTIGRDADNELVLADRNRIISKRHCVIEEVGGSYQLMDHSRNGTFLNDDPQPVPRDVPVKLRVGDLLHVGCFALSVVAAGSDDAAASAHAAPIAQDSALFAPEPPLEPARHPAPDGPWEDAVPPAGVDVLDALGEKARFVSTRAAVDDHAAPGAGVFIQPKARHEPIPDDWDLAAELGIPPARGPSAPPVGPAAGAPPAVLPGPAEAPPGQPGGERQALAAIEAFLGGCGLSAADVGATDLATMMGRAGQALRISVTGLHEMLGARISAKQGFGMEPTLLERSRNNPLKFVDNGHEALRAVLVTAMPGFLVGAEMVEEAFLDSKSHQLAMLAAMRAALGSVCRQLAPDTIEAASGRPTLAQRMLPAKRAALHWARYRAVFDDVASGLDNDAARIFGGDFVRAYQDNRGDPAPQPSTALDHAAGQGGSLAV